jgi:hypothetical protein
VSSVNLRSMQASMKVFVVHESQERYNYCSRDYVRDYPVHADLFDIIKTFHRATAVKKGIILFQSN